MKDGDTKGQEQLIRNLKERLHWYAYECEPEEFNEKEVKTIVDLLKQLDPIEPQEYFNAQKGVERFWKYYEQRMEEEEDLDRLGARNAERRMHGGNNSHDDMEAARDMDVLDYVGVAKERETAVCGNLEKNKIMDKEIRGSGRSGFMKNHFSFFRRHRAMTGTVAAAALVVMVMFGGTFGAYAEKDTGFFHWISKDKSGVEIITSPTPESATINAGVNGTQRYNNIDVLPEELLSELWLPDEVPRGLEFQYVDVMTTSGWKRTTSTYKNQDLSLHFDIDIKVFEESVVFHRQSFADYDYLYSKVIDDCEMEFFVKESDDETEYAMCFYGENEQYSIQGNLAEDEIKTLAVSFAQFIFKK